MRGRVLWVKCLSVYAQRDMVLLIRPTIQSRKMAPTTEVIRLPMMPPAVIPRSPKSHPPSTPPIIPTTRLTMIQKPPPCINLTATNPATMPIRMYHKKLITMCFLICYYSVPYLFGLISIFPGMITVALKLNIARAASTALWQKAV